MEELWWARVVEIRWKFDDLRVSREGVVVPTRNGAVCLLCAEFLAVLAAVSLYSVHCGVR